MDGDVGERLLQGDAIFEARDAVHAVAAAAEVASLFGVQRCPEFGGFGGNEMKVAWKYADDGVRLFVEDDGLAENVGAAAIALLPGGVAENCGAGSGE